MSYFDGINSEMKVWHQGFGEVEVGLVCSTGFYIRKGENNYSYPVSFEGVISGEKFQSVFWTRPEIIPPARPKMKVKKKGWVSIFRAGKINYVTTEICSNRDAAKGSAAECKNYVDTVKIEWEEEE